MIGYKYGGGATLFLIMVITKAFQGRFIFVSSLKCSTVGDLEGSLNRFHQFGKGAFFG